MRNNCLPLIFAVMLLALVSCHSTGQYPAHWWQPVSAEGAPAWEILPQAAGPGEVILSKRQLIVEATREKVRQNPKVRKVLLATGNLVLQPDHHQEPNAPAAWRYYEILTRIRAELRQHTP